MSQSTAVFPIEAPHQEACHSPDPVAEVQLPTDADDAAVARLQAGSRGEHAEDYGAVVATLNGRWRVISCPAGIQWILQQRRGLAGGESRWQGRSYCRSRAGLLACVREHCGQIDASAIGVLRRLPDWIEQTSTGVEAR